MQQVVCKPFELGPHVILPCITYRNDLANVSAQCCIYRPLILVASFLFEQLT